jgi:large subunit ribosomal protein L10
MPSQKNIHSLAEVKHGLETAKAVILANNLLMIALKEKLGGLPRDIEDVLRGPTAVIFAQTDAVTTTKAITEFAKDKNLPEIKIGLMDDKVLSIKDLETLSKLPSREQLLATLLAQLQAPVQAFVRQINAPAQLLVYALDAIKNKK